jgi:hypothetical protein
MMANKYLEKIAKVDTIAKVLLRPPVVPGLAKRIAEKRIANQLADVAYSKGRTSVLPVRR